MIFIRGIWPLRRATLWYEPAERVRSFLRGFAAVHVYSYAPLDLPGFRLVKKKQTPVVDVRGKTIEEMLAAFRDTTRNEIRRTFAMPELAFTIEKPSRELYEFYVAATHSQGRKPQGCGLFRDSQVAVARRGNMILAAVAFIPAHPVLKVLTISSLRRESGDPQERNLIGYCTKRLIHELCVRAIYDGYESLDLAYINLTDPAKRGITDFKMGFGGVIRDEWQYEKAHWVVHLKRLLHRL